MGLGYEIALVGLIWTIVVALGSWYFAVWRIERKLNGKYVVHPPHGGSYRLQEAAEECMKERKKAEGSIIKVLRRMEKRMALGNVVMRDLVEANPDIPNDQIEKYERDLGITLGDRSFGIPEG